MYRKFGALLLLLAVLLMAAGCKKDQGGTTPPTVELGVPPAYANVFTDRDLDSGYAGHTTIDLSSAEDQVLITKAGTYLLTGTLENGQILVQAGDQDKVQIVLKDVSVTNTAGAALYIKSGDKVFVTLEGSNSLTVNGSFTQTDENNVDGAVYSKSDLTFNGSGGLRVDCESGHGIVSKDDLKITGGTYTVNATGQGLSGKDLVAIGGGTITVTSGTDGIQSKNDEDTTRGEIYIAAGTLNITAGNDGMDASNRVTVLDGRITVLTGEGSAAVSQSQSDWGDMFMGRPGMGGWDSGNSGTGDVSRKGIKAGSALVIQGGSLTLDTEDDSLHCNGDAAISGGSMTLSAGDDGIHADSTLQVSDGTVTVSRSKEGLEAAVLTISGGEINLTASDDGINAAGGNDSSGFDGPWGKDPFAEDADAGVYISGGTLRMNAGGDGLDSNGSLTVTGGTVYVDGPTNGGNGAIDCGGEAIISGGTVIALGSSQMAQNFSSNSTQGVISYDAYSTQSAGTTVQIKDSDGNVLASMEGTKQFQNIVISAPGMEEGETYTLTIGDGEYTITLDSIVYGGSGSMMPGGMGGGMGGGMPGGGGGRPGGMGGPR